jgi:hypothetical protein
VIIDPHVAVISVSKEHGPALYEGVMRRVAERREQPQGVLLHYTCHWGDAFIVGTVFRDIASMTEGFVGFSAPEAQNEMVETGLAQDMSRQEFRLERMFVEPGVEAQPFGFVEPAGVIAFTTEAIMPSIETYREIARQPGFFDKPADGRIAHIAHISPTGVRVMTFWRSRAQGERWNEEHLYGPLAELEPGKLTEESREAAWLEIDSFLVAAAADDPTRNFVRAATGPSTV